MNAQQETIIVTGGSGMIGSALIRRLAADYRVVCADIAAPAQLPPSASFVRLDLTSDEGVAAALQEVRAAHGGRIASVVHLAAYFDLSGDPSPKYEAVTVKGTERLLDALQGFEVEQFVFSSTMLVHAPTEPGRPIDEEWPLDPGWPYPESKAATEAVVRERRGAIPAAILRIAGVYSDSCGSPFLAQQMARIYERQMISHFYPGDLRCGQAFLHTDDLIEALARVVARRRELPEETTLLLGEPEAVSYDQLQRAFGRLLHAEDWETYEVPKALAKTGTWIEDEVLDEEPFIRPWMIDSADDHYELDIRRARELLGWWPRHRLAETLPKMAAALKADPPGWYAAHKLDAAKVAAQAPEPSVEHRSAAEVEEASRRVHLRTLWAPLLNVGLGAWLAASPFVLGYFASGGFSDAVLRVTEERGLAAPETRHALMAASDIAAGLLVAVFAALSLSPRRAWPPWATAAVGVWLLMAPVLFWAPSAAAYANDTLVGALVVALAVVVPPPRGIGREALAAGPDLPPGWSYCPSSYLQRLPIAALAFLGFLLARYMAAYQLGHIDRAWDPFFGDGTMAVLDSEVSHAFPVSDAGLGAVAYMLEVLVTLAGDRRRWRTMPWLVALFGVLVVPLGAVSILFIIIQPIVIGTWCAVCLVAAAGMLAMIPLAVGEVVAMGQFLAQSGDQGPLLRRFLRGGPLEHGEPDPTPAFDAGLPQLLRGMVSGVTVPWTLAASVLVGAWLMLTRLLLGTAPPTADSDHLVGALAITIAVIAMAEVARPLRFLNVPLGLWAAASPWLLGGAGTFAAIAAVVAGLALAGLSLPRGPVRQSYGAWNAWIV